jgi:hypothetical protein
VLAMRGTEVRVAAQREKARLRSWIICMCVGLRELL